MSAIKHHLSRLSLAAISIVCFFTGCSPVGKVFHLSYNNRKVPLEVGLNRHCFLPSDYVAISDPRVQLLNQARDQLSLAAGITPNQLHNAIIRRKDGQPSPTAMTCEAEGYIWFSVAMIDLLQPIPIAIEWVYAHEMGHRWHDLPLAPRSNPAQSNYAADIYNRLNTHQLMEVAADQRGIDILWNAGLPIEFIPAIIGKIARSHGSYYKVAYGDTHPHPQDREELAAAYIQQVYGVQSSPFRQFRSPIISKP